VNWCGPGGSVMLISAAGRNQVLDGTASPRGPGSELGGWLDVSFRAGGREVALEVDFYSNEWWGLLSVT
jgi:hypothetical protein